MFPATAFLATPASVPPLPAPSSPCKASATGQLPPRPSTRTGGINLAGGCFAIAGTCVGGGGGSGTVTSITAGTGLTGGTITTSGTIALDLSHANNWTGLQQFTNASTSLFSAYG